MDKDIKIAIIRLLAVTGGVLICLGVFLAGFTSYQPYENAEWENLKAKMTAEASRLEFEFGRCFENLSAGDLAGLSDNGIYSFVGNLMPLGSLALLSDNIYSVTVNQVHIGRLENENLGPDLGLSRKFGSAIIQRTEP
jgi:hypothetical protein